VKGVPCIRAPRTPERSACPGKSEGNDLMTLATVGSFLKHRGHSLRSGRQNQPETSLFSPYGFSRYALSSADAFVLRGPSPMSPARIVRATRRRRARWRDLRPGTVSIGPIVVCKEALWRSAWCWRAIRPLVHERPLHEQQMTYLPVRWSRRHRSSWRTILWSSWEDVRLLSRKLRRLFRARWVGGSSAVSMPGSGWRWS